MSSTKGRLRRIPAAAMRVGAGVLAAAVVGTGVVLFTSTTASAVVTVNIPSGNDLSLFNFTAAGGPACPAGAGESIVAAVGPGSDYVTNGEGFIAALTGAEAESGNYTTTNWSIANLRTATATFGTGPFPQDYAINLYCGGLDPVIQLATLTILSIGQDATNTFTLTPVGGGSVPVTTTPSTTSGPTTTPSTATASTTRITTASAIATSSSGTATTATPATTVRAATTPTATTTTRQGTLADTGSDRTGFWLAGSLIAGGVVLVLLTVRRRSLTGTHRG